jgi:hypothetical protein
VSAIEDLPESLKQDGSSAIPPAMNSICLIAKRLSIFIFDYIFIMACGNVVIANAKPCITFKVMHFQRYGRERVQFHAKAGRILT